MVSDSLRSGSGSKRKYVLILVLMEYGLWHRHDAYFTNYWGCLNPCSNGIWSLTWLCHLWSPPARRLNPCSNGIWSLTGQSMTATSGELVLILVLMEYGLWPCRTRPSAHVSASLNPCSNGIWSLTGTKWPVWNISSSLNPCSNGIWSLTRSVSEKVVELPCLNPCSNGIWSLTGKPVLFFVLRRKS